MDAVYTQMSALGFGTGLLFRGTRCAARDRQHLLISPFDRFRPQLGWVDFFRLVPLRLTDGQRHTKFSGVAQKLRLFYGGTLKFSRRG